MILVLEQGHSLSLENPARHAGRYAFLPGLSPVGQHGISARFDGGSLSCDGGLLLLREIKRKLKFADRLASCLHDRRDAGRIVHDYASMISERMFAIACGHEDCNDLDTLRHDPALKIACERLPDSGNPLASQPTLSRLGNTPSWRELARMGLALIDLFCDSFRTVPNPIVLDIDDTTDRTHGGQQLCLFNTHAGGYWLQPIHIYDAATGKQRRQGAPFLTNPLRRQKLVKAAQGHCPCRGERTGVRYALAGRAKPLYEKVYCARGRVENLIKEHKLYTISDRTSCHRWEANPFRLFLHTGAYWLLLLLRGAAPKRSRFRTATFETIRRAFVKIAVRVEQLKSRITIALPTAYPQRKMPIVLMQRIKAQSP